MVTNLKQDYTLKYYDVYISYFQQLLINIFK